MSAFLTEVGGACGTTRTVFPVREVQRFRDDGRSSWLFNHRPQPRHMHCRAVPCPPVSSTVDITTGRGRGHGEVRCHSSLRCCKQWDGSLNKHTHSHTDWTRAPCSEHGHMHRHGRHAARQPPHSHPSGSRVLAETLGPGLHVDVLTPPTGMFEPRPIWLHQCC